MKDNCVYIGEDFSLMMIAVSDDTDKNLLDNMTVDEILESPDVKFEDLSEYDIVVQISTTPFGAVIVASTTNNGIDIQRRDNSCIGVNFTKEVTKNLAEGKIIVSIMLTHKTTGVQIIAEKRTIQLIKSRIDASLL